MDKEEINFAEILVSLMPVSKTIPVDLVDEEIKLRAFLDSMRTIRLNPITTVSAGIKFIHYFTWNAFQCRIR